MKREIPLAIVFIFGVVMAVQYFVPHSYSKSFFDYMMDFLRISGVPAVVIGVVSVTRVHWAKVKRRMPGYAYSVVTLATFVVMSLAGFVKEYDAPRGPFQFLFHSVQIPINATMFSLLAFFIASAAYRSFRARNVQATILLLAAVIVMIGRTSLWGYIPFVGKAFPFLTEWLMYVPNLAAKRGIYLGMTLGAVATSLKIILGIERAYLGSTGGGD